MAFVRVTRRGQEAQRSTLSKSLLPKSGAVFDSSAKETIERGVMRCMQQSV
jgi:hypothetical protein